MFNPHLPQPEMPQLSNYLMIKLSNSLPAAKVAQDFISKDAEKKVS